jgi:hypothetical protein
MDIAAGRYLADDKGMRRSVSPVLLTLVLALFLLPPLYVASAGPVIWCRDRRIVTQGQVDAVYWPLAWTITHVPLVGKAINSYCRLWSTPEVP